jgi:hypothetical protein
MEAGEKLKYHIEALIPQDASDVDTINHRYQQIQVQIAEKMKLEHPTRGVFKVWTDEEHTTEFVAQDLISMAADDKGDAVEVLFITDK